MTMGADTNAPAVRRAHMIIWALTPSRPLRAGLSFGAVLRTADTPQTREAPILYGRNCACLPKGHGNEA
jgi:hypothetical protein